MPFPPPPAAAFSITGGQDGIQSVAGQRRGFFSESGDLLPQFPVIAHSLGWEFGSVVPGFAGEGYLSTWDSGIPGATWASSATTRYELRLANAGPRVLWIRRSAPNGAGNSAFVGLNGQLSGEFDNTSSGWRRGA